jgi:hypothetical protein
MIGGDIVNTNDILIIINEFRKHDRIYGGKYTEYSYPE